MAGKNLTLISFFLLYTLWIFLCACLIIPCLLVHKQGEVQYFIGVQLDGSKHVEPLQNSIPEAAVVESEKQVSPNESAFLSIAMALSLFDCVIL